jgi:ammonium transporter Rh
MATPTEATTLLNNHDNHGVTTRIASQRDSNVVNTIFLISQLLFLCYAVVLADNSSSSNGIFSTSQYMVFRDIMAMLLLGFGFLMTFLQKYGLGAVGFTLMLTALSMEYNIMVEALVRYIYTSCLWGEMPDGEEGGNWDITMSHLIDSEFAAATLLITYGALIGHTSPLQLLIVAMFQGVAYAVNKVIFVLGMFHSEDVGGSITIHMFGAYFGLACSAALCHAKSKLSATPSDAATAIDTEDMVPDKVSDVMALIGTGVLWIYWPSFVGATETGVLANESKCVMNTVIAPVASTVMTFAMSQYVCAHGANKFDPVHIANCTLAGGVAIGSSARLAVVGPAGAMITGSCAGFVSVLGYKYSTPYLQTKYGIMDTCGVGNLHGYPSIVGALLSVVFVALSSEEEFLHSMGISQMARQLAGMVFTLALSGLTGYATGLFASRYSYTTSGGGTKNFEDHVWWHLEY